MYSHASALKTLFNLCDNLKALINQNEDQQRQSTLKGQQLYNLGEFAQAKNYLTIGACAGNADAQYALAEVIRGKYTPLHEDAKDWYALAAAQGHVYALMRLGDAASIKTATAVAQASVDRKEASGMLLMYELTLDLAWLKKAADAGSLEGQYILADKYDRDRTLLPDDNERRTAIDGLLKKAAEGGLSKAMFWYANRQPISRDLPVRRQWVEKRAHLNDVNGVLDYGFILSGMYENDEGVDEEYGFERDVVKGYGLVWLVVESTRELSRHATARAFLSELATEMTETQISAAKDFAQQWTQAHVPMSQYRLSYNDIN